MIQYWIFNFLVVLGLYNLIASCISYRIICPDDDDMPHSDQIDEGLPYSDHPLYKLRVKSVITAIIGFILGFIVLAGFSSYYSYGIPSLFFSIVFLFISFIFVLHDLISYAAAKAAALISRSDLPIVTLPTEHHIPAATAARNSEHSIPLRRRDNKPAWPTRRLLIIDFILAFIFQFLFWVGLGSSAGSYRYGYGVFEAYANLTNMAASILHGVAFWKVLMVRKKRVWLRNLEPKPCGNCGHLNNVAQEPSTTASATDASTRHTHTENDPPSSNILESFEKVKAALPKWPKTSVGGERDVENDAAEAAAPLLVTPDESTTEVGGPSSGYGTLDQSVGSIPETLVKKKSKGKKRMVEVDSE